MAINLAKSRHISWTDRNWGIDQQAISACIFVRQNTLPNLSLVAVGRGLQQEDNLEIVQRLADALGAAVAASRPVVDQGWLPATRQVGKSGMKVKPKCYLALGISGAPEHVEGMQESELTIAVNTDPRAPIFDVADFGAVADMLDVAENLAEKIEAR